MKDLFKLDNPVMQVMGRIGDLIILSVITIVMCLPVVTFGPAVTALFKTVYTLTLDTCGGVISTYFQAFRDNFKQAAIVGCIMLAALASFAYDLIILRTSDPGTVRMALLGTAAVLALLLLCVTAYLFPLIARYHNLLREHLRNATVLMVMNFPRTLLLVGLHVLPAALLFYQTLFMMRTLPAWLLLGPGGIAQLDSYLLRPVFQQLEKEASENTGENEVE